MRTRVSSLWLIGLFNAILLLAGPARAQFSGNIEGVVTDPSGGSIGSAKITITNLSTNVSASSTTESTVELQYNQTLNVPVEMKVGAANEKITVTAEAPLLNTSETRNQLTLETRELNTLPLAGRSMISLVTLAPGVSGLGTQTSNAPGSGVDNYSTETAVDVSANGQGTVANQFIIDGLNVTSSIRQGVLNLTPNPDTIQETSIQVNTFSVEYGGGSSIQMSSTTKSGSDQFHGLASDYFTYQNMLAKFSLPGAAKKYAPFHSNNLSGAIGGPIIPHHQFFFFFAIEPPRSSTSTGGATINSPDP